jgi:ketosteroid isomerase-like protein
MSSENVERYYRFADAFNRRNLDAVLAFLDPDVDWEPRSVALEGGHPYRGHEGFRTWWESTFTAFSDHVAEVEGVRDFGDTTVSRLRFRGHGKESGVPIDEVQWHVVEWRSGSLAFALSEVRPKPSRPPGSRTKRTVSEPAKAGAVRRTAWPGWPGD